MSSGWYLQHVTTGSRHILHKGINVVGRHSRCNIVLAGTYQYVSREHAKLDVSDGGVVVQSMNALNGIFINEGKLGEKINRLAVAEGSTISLGVSGVPLKEISSIHAIFVLKKIVPTAEEVILSSDDDDTQPLPAVRSPSGNQPTEFNLKQQIPNFPLKKNTSQEEEVELPSSSGLIAFSDGEEDFLEFNGMESMAEGSPSSQVYEEIVIISDSDDNELYDKVADWSKLLSQKVVPDVIEMSQTYPLAEEDFTN
ncbi:uncharacterized protein LOC123037421 [Drosophila rhopaloa]|uniref:FHA domain-containing protein n=1 Tax=Drosophila rhopaloa TaxID=1041015 RepID=A0ABM5J512_DRORH|nr:uncharacterized protein LOC123037421 [Drosophila rhopaloa]